MGMDCAATETVGKPDSMLEEKGEKKEINEPENGKHSTCSSEWHNTTSKFVHVHLHKRCFFPKRI